MILHENTLISEDIFENEFVCNISKCKGSCCVEGEFGAPILDEEIKIIESHLDKIKPYMNEAGLKVLNRNGFYEYDVDKELVTTCVKGRDCLFAISEEGIYKCAIEKAHDAGEIDFKKPISCHLYPIRIEQLTDYEALNYSRWDICSPACSLGASLHVPVYVFLKDALVRKFGEEWYNELVEIGEGYRRSIGI